MPFRIKVSLAVLLSLLTLLFVGPLITTVPPLENTVSAVSLADADSKFIDLGDLNVHYKTAGDPAADHVFILIHGFGSSLYTWHKLMPALAEQGYVLAFDRIAFGLTERPMRGDWTGESPYSDGAQREQLVELMTALGIDKAVLLGHSSGGALAAEFALEYPDKVEALVLFDPAVFRTGGAPAWSRFLLHTPQLNRIGPLIMRQFGGEPGQNFLKSAWYDPEKLSDDDRAAYQETLSVHDWDKALWELSKANQNTNLSKQLGAIEQPVLLISGEEDKVVPLDYTQRLADELGQAELETFSACGHIPQEECPDRVIPAVLAWLNTTLEP
ncbi:MAG: alpha/beta hydrolase [Trueperaceae bacterium]|nr:alpha/beta hydrolase [Trueperaceae bacterium]